MPAAAARVRAVSSVERTHSALNLCGVVLYGTRRCCQRTNGTSHAGHNMMMISSTLRLLLNKFQNTSDHNVVV